MPKMKTRSAAKKRFRVSANGKVRRRTTNSRHNLGKKTRKQKRAFRDDRLVADSDMNSVKQMLPGQF